MQALDVLWGKSVPFQCHQAMNDSDCVLFLQWALPRIGMRWTGFRRVRGQVRKRLDRRMRELGLAGAAEYRVYLEANPDEWTVLEGICRITISRFYRDRAVFESLRRLVLPDLAAQAQATGRRSVRAWSVGCASGEEPYSVLIAWHYGAGPQFPEIELEVVGTDLDPALIERARAGRYQRGSIRELLPEWIDTVFEERKGLFTIRPDFRRGLELLSQDVRQTVPEGRFDLILCRNLVLTYFDEVQQRSVLPKLIGRLFPSGAFVTGVHERLPEGWTGLKPWDNERAIYRSCRAAQGSHSST